MNECMTLDRILLKPFEPIEYTHSDHLSSTECVYKAHRIDLVIQINEFGKNIVYKDHKYTSHIVSNDLSVNILRNVFVSHYCIFDEDGNIYPDSFRMGLDRNMATCYTKSLPNQQVFLKKEIRDKLIRRIQVASATPSRLNEKAR